MLLRCALLVLAVTAATLSAAPPPLILISLDAFRHDYCDLHPAETPNLRALKDAGVSAGGLIPVFPSNTFPNHYAIVTGLYPGHHGIINNDFFDAESGRFFHSNISALVRDPRWWGGEPVWVTAIKQNRAAAASFWVGSEAKIHGLQPTYWRVFDLKVTFEERLEELIGWLKLPADRRPVFVSFYMEETNTAGHNYGPDSPELVAAIKLLDSRVGRLAERLKQEGIAANLIVVSDHGMTKVAAERVQVLEDYVDLDSAQVDFQGSVAGLRPLQGSVEALVEKLTRLPHAKVYRAEGLPARLHVIPGPRVPPVWVLPEEGWHVVTRAGFAKYKERSPDGSYLRGDHGFDPSLPTMQGTFIACGPSFKSGVVLPAVENIHLYNLLCAAVGLTPAPNDGDDRLVKAVLR